jgi:hypothetical protein
MIEKDDLFSFLQSQKDERRIDFLRTELQACFTFVNVAETHDNNGKQEHAAQSLADAEQGCAALQRFLSDPRHAKHIRDKERKALQQR